MNVMRLCVLENRHKHCGRHGITQQMDHAMPKVGSWGENVGSSVDAGVLGGGRMVSARPHTHAQKNRCKSAFRK